MMTMIPFQGCRRPRTRLDVDEDEEVEHGRIRGAIVKKMVKDGTWSQKGGSEGGLVKDHIFPLFSKTSSSTLHPHQLLTWWVQDS